MNRFPGKSNILRLVAILAVAVMILPSQVGAAGGTGHGVANYSGLTSAQQATLLGLARDSWNFYKDDVDPTTHLPLDNVTYAGGSPTPTSYGRYTSAANIGVYLWAVVAANDMGLITRPQARQQIEATLTIRPTTTPSYRRTAVGCSRRRCRTWWCRRHRGDRRASAWRTSSTHGSS
ncbi:MAG: hypothetical protein ACR2JC_20965 [Chloroflexota bacterium]